MTRIKKIFFILISILLILKFACTPKNPLEFARPTLTKVNIETGKTYFIINERYQFKAIGIFTNNKQQNITHSVSWSSTYPNIGKIDSLHGFFRAVSAGATQIIISAQITPEDRTITISDTSEDIIILPQSKLSIGKYPIKIVSGVGSSALCYVVCKNSNMLYCISSTPPYCIKDSLYVEGLPKDIKLITEQSIAYVLCDDYTALPFIRINPLYKIDELFTFSGLPRYLEIDQDSRRIFVVVPYKKKILRTKFEESYAEIDAVLPSKNIGDIAVTSSKIYISDSGLHKIWILDKYTFDFTHEREVKNYKGSFPDKQFLFEDMEKIYILDSMLPSVSIIDIQTDTINKYIDLDDHYPIDLITAGSYAYVIFRRHNEIGVINIVDDLLEGYIKSTEEIKYIENITDVKVIVDNNNNGYIVDRYGRRIIRFSQSEKKYISEIPIFGNPLDLTLSENEEKLIVSFYSQEATRDTLIIMDPF